MDPSTQVSSFGAYKPGEVTIRIPPFKVPTPEPMGLLGCRRIFEGEREVVAPGQRFDPAAAGIPDVFLSFKFAVMVLREFVHKRKPLYLSVFGSRPEQTSGRTRYRRLVHVKGLRDGPIKRLFVGKLRTAFALLKRFHIVGQDFFGDAGYRSRRPTRGGSRY